MREKFTFHFVCFDISTSRCQLAKWNWIKAFVIFANITKITAWTEYWMSNCVVAWSNLLDTHFIFISFFFAPTVVFTIGESGASASDSSTKQKITRHKSNIFKMRKETLRFHWSRYWDNLLETCCFMRDVVATNFRTKLWPTMNQTPPRPHCNAHISVEALKLEARPNKIALIY